MTGLSQASLSQRGGRSGTRGVVSIPRVLFLGCAIAVMSCKPAIATSDECEQVARHLADLQVKKEKRPPLGRLASKGFDTKENEDAVFAEAKDNAKARCVKGWKRAIYDCMMQAQEIEAADKCRFE
jgi:hypothetical protein